MATRDPDQLGKPLEAVIAFFNPEMVAEWSVFHDAELHLDSASADGRARWYVVVPRDDGTLTAAITAARLTDGEEEPPLIFEGNSFAVQRLGAFGAPVSLQVGDALVLASSRDELPRGLRRIHAPSPVRPRDSDQPDSGGARLGPFLRSRSGWACAGQVRVAGGSPRCRASSRTGMSTPAWDSGPQRRSSRFGADDVPRPSGSAPKAGRPRSIRPGWRGYRPRE